MEPEAAGQSTLIDAEEFDRAIAECEPGQRQAADRIKPEILRLKLLTPEVAQAVAAGMTANEIAAITGVPYSAVVRYLRRAEMKDLLAIESRRIVKHLMTRDLKRERYLALTTSLSMLIDKAELLSGNPTDRVENTGQGQTTVIERLNVAIFGARGIATSPPNGLQSPLCDERPSLPAVPGDPGIPE